MPTHETRDDAGGIDDEPPFGSFPEERGYDDLQGAPYAQAVAEIQAREIPPERRVMTTKPKQRRITKVQRMLLDLMKLSSFNEFNGPKVVESLLAHRDLWIAVMMDREAYRAQSAYQEQREKLKKGEDAGLPISPIDTIRLRDLCEGYWNVDAVFIIPEPGKEDSLELLVRREWNADEIDWYDPLDAGVILHGGISANKPIVTTKVDRILRVWWD